MRRSIACLLLPALAACGAADAEPPDLVGLAPVGGPRFAGRDVDASTAGSVAGLVVVDGRVPAPARLDVPADACCRDATGEAPLDDALLVADGRLANAVVWVSAGVEGFRFVPDDAPAEIRFDHCAIVPRVSAVMAGQSVRFHNDDPQRHDVRLLAARNPSRDLPMPEGAEPFTFGFRRAEQPVSVRCDPHPWSAAVIAVLDTTCFAVTGADGRYELRGVPPGHYTLEAWHEVLGRCSTEVDVAPAEAALAPALIFTFKGP